MSDKKLLEELKHVKNQQEQLQKKINSLETKIARSSSDSVGEKEEKALTSNNNEDTNNSKSSSPTPYIVIGLLLSFTGIGAIAGIPLLIIGLYKLLTKDKSSKQDLIQDKTKNINLNKNTILKLLGRAGITLTVIGIAFFINYAIELGYLGYGARLLLAGFFGLSLIATGYKLHKNKSYYLLSGFLSVGGFVITYFTVFSSYFFEDYREAVGMTFPFASALLAIVVIGMIYYTVNFGNAATTALAYILGYFSLFLSEGDGLITIVYLALLTLSALYISYIKNWDLLPSNIIAMHYISSFFLLGFNSFTSSEFIFLTVIFVLIHVFSELYLKSKAYITTKGLNNILYTISVAFALRAHQYIDYFFFILAFALFITYLSSRVEESKYTDLVGSIVAIVIYSLLDLSSVLTTVLWGALAVFNAYVYNNNKEFIFKLATYFFAGILLIKNLTYDLLFNTAPYLFEYVQESTVLMFLSIVAYIVIVKVLNNAVDKNIFATGSMLMGAVIISVELSELYLVLALIAISVALFTSYKYTNLLAIKVGNYIYLGGAVLQGFQLLVTSNSKAIISNEALTLFLAIFVSIMYSYKEDVKSLRTILSYVSFALFLLVVALEFTNFVITMIWAVTGLGLLSIGLNKNKDVIRNMGLISLALAVVKLFLIDTLDLDVLYRTLAYIGLGLILLVATFVFSKDKDKFQN